VWVEAAQPTSADLMWYQQQQHAAEADSSSLGPHQLTLDRLALLNRQDSTPQCDANGITLRVALGFWPPDCAMIASHS